MQTADFTALYTNQHTSCHQGDFFFSLCCAEQEKNIQTVPAQPGHSSQLSKKIAAPSTYSHPLKS